ncbi:MAG TPA: MMPL family transporter [Solirubrobacteraceae bacterium]|jgi:RND superfamily putative drug exporter
MATHLYRLGGWAFERRRTVLALWGVLLAAVIASAVAFGGSTNDKFSVPGTDSQQAQDLLEAKFPAASGTYARIVFAAPEGEKLTDPANKAAVEATLAKARGAADVSQVTTPYETGAITKDGTVAFGDVIYPVPAHEIGDAARDELAATAVPAEKAGVQVEYGGGLVTEEQEASSESTGMLIGFVVLAITLGSLLAAGMPLLTALIGVGMGVAGIIALSGSIEVSSVAPTLATMLGLAVGIDYALFILTRHRQNLGEGMTPREAAARATATAGSAVVFAGTTVIIALVGLLVINIPFLSVMGLAAAGTVALAVLIAITLLPAVLGFAGERMRRSNRVLVARPWRRKPGTETMSVRWARFVTRRPLVTTLASVAVLGTIAIPALHMKLGLPDGGSKPTSTTERRAYDLLTDGFGPGFNGPLTVVVDAPGLDESGQKAVANAVVKDLEGLPGVAAVAPAVQNEKGDLTIASVTPTSSPASDETKDLVALIRDKADQVQADTGIHAYVTGTTALNIDTNDTLSAALPRYIAVVVGLALLLLTIVFRSVLVPIKAALGFLLSIAASMGLTVWIFQDGNMADLFNVGATGPIVSFLPVLLIGILFGLAMDYEVFLLSRMRESFVHTNRSRESIVTGFGQSGRVVVAAALIMIGVFGGFVLDNDPIVKSIGLSLAFGVLADAFVVRMTLVPAVMALLGRSAWRLPSWLARVLPDLDIEGEKLMRSLA